MLNCISSSARLRPLGHGRRSAVRGLSIIELLIGVAIGLAIVAGGAKLLADGLMSNRRSVAEARISHDLRAAADVIARDLRRAGYWASAHQSVTGAPILSGYSAVTLPALETIRYSYAIDGNNVSDPAEQFGFSRGVDPNNGNGVLFMDLGNNNPQPLTDSRNVNITDFDVTPITGEISLGDMCRTSNVTPGPTPTSACCRPLPSNGGQCKQPIVERRGNTYLPNTGFIPPIGTQIDPDCPELLIRSFEIVITGTGVGANADVTRTIRETVRVRNDLITGAAVVCPP